MKKNNENQVNSQQLVKVLKSVFEGKIEVSFSQKFGLSSCKIQIQENCKKTVSLAKTILIKLIIRPIVFTETFQKCES